MRGDGGATRRTAAWALLAGLAWVASARGEDDPAAARNVILMVADGGGLEHFTLARWFKGAPLALDEIRTGSLRTYVAGSTIGESAAAATAFATGHLARAKHLGLAPVPPGSANDMPHTPAEVRPFATVVEAARLSGLSVGLVATSSFTHATPAGFFAHVNGRAELDMIAVQGVHAGLNLVLAGGWGDLRPPALGGRRSDGLDLTADLRSAGCAVVTTAEALSTADGACVWGLFADEGLTPMVDRPAQGAGEPTLAEMTRKAIDLLARNPRGFFLMVEGSQIDWAAHANDAGYLVREVLAFDDAVAVALDFARRDGRTLLLTVSDHSTGGLSIAGRKQRGRGAADALVGPLHGMRCSAETLVKRLGPNPLAATVQQVRRVVAKGWGLEISPTEALRILERMAKIKKPKDRERAFGALLSHRHLGLDWTSHDHAGGDVPLHAYGPGRPVGTLSTPDVGRLCEQALGLDLRQATERLFVDAREAFGPGAVTIRSEPSGGRTALISAGEGAVAEIPLNANRLLSEGQTHRLEGIAFELPQSDKLYVPRDAVELLRQDGAARP